MKENVRQSECGLRCKYCGYDTREDVIKAAFWMGDGLIVIEDVLARVCEGCGEQFLDEETTQRIQGLLKNPAMEPRQQIRVSVYDLSRLESMAKHRRGPPQGGNPAQSIRNSDPEISPKCKYCESETVEELVKSVFWVNEQLIAIENIRARVCQRCNVQFYDDETAETIATLEKVRAVPDAVPKGTPIGARRDATVSVFSLSD